MENDGNMDFYTLICSKEVGVCALRSCRAERVQASHVVPATAAPPHPGIDLDMERESPPSRDVRVLECGAEIVLRIGIPLLPPGRREDENRAPDTGIPQHGGLIERDHRESPWIQCLQGPRRLHGPESVPVCLDDGKQRGSACDVLDGARVGDEVAQIHRDPGAIGGVR